MADDLTLRLDEVEDLDPVGLLASWESEYADDDTPLLLLGDDRYGAVWAVSYPGELPRGCDTANAPRAQFYLRDEIFVSLADSATRDRLAHCLARRVGLKVGATAPQWRRLPGLGIWRLSAPDPDDSLVECAVYFAADETSGWRGDRIVPALASIDLADPQADWLALAALCRAVEARSGPGKEVTE